ncbi:hypothetical protein [Pseudovibrio ascidiaceicola]|uniref:hypothetical protein n=1 Tax=Pseudovibrio ascidiaceicola TaxID=285279 RepID=UPI001AD8BEA0|nr:hypothetical protein [Pseudovibrio ascidiaceicola]
MVGFLLRFIGVWFVAIALVSFVVDATKSIATSSWTSSPLGLIWFDLSPETLNASQAAIQRYVSPLLWDPIIQSLLLMPPWVIFGPLGLIMLWYGDKRRRINTTLL